MIAQKVLRAAIVELRKAEVPEPARDARLLLAYALGCAVDRLTLILQDEISQDEVHSFHQLVARRMERQPISQIIGARQFFGRTFSVTPDVLDPRPETETLVEQAIGVQPKRVLDIGTGSGCVLLSILAECPSAQGLAVDISENALDVARQNGQRLDVADRAAFARSDWFSEVEGKFDLIVSNPPYIDEDEWLTLDPEPRLWEPKIALTPGADGLQPYREIAKDAHNHILHEGWLMVEIGWTQGKSVRDIFGANGFQNLRVVQDLGGRDRVVVGQRS